MHRELMTNLVVIVIKYIHFARYIASDRVCMYVIKLIELIILKIMESPTVKTYLYDLYEVINCYNKYNCHKYCRHINFVVK